jgi:hypothetical protein
MLLHELAHSRSGDKATTSDISVIAYRAADYPFLVEHLTAERVGAYFADIVGGDVRRYELPRMHALKFVLSNTLGGVTRSLELDIHGKNLASSRLAIELP